MRYTQEQTAQWKRGLRDRGIVPKTPAPVNDIKIQDIMSAAMHWLTHPEHQHRVTERELSFVASVHLQFRQGKQISTKQKGYVVAILSKHSK